MFRYSENVLLRCVQSGMLLLLLLYAYPIFAEELQPRGVQLRSSGILPPEQGKALPLYYALDVLPNPIGKIIDEEMTDERLNSLFIPLSKVDYSFLSGGMWLRFSLRGSAIQSKHLYLNLGSYVSSPIIVYRSIADDNTTQFDKLGTYESSRILLQTADARTDATYTYYISLPNIPSPFFYPILENGNSTLAHSISIIHILCFGLLLLCILFSLLRAILQRKMLFLFLPIFSICLLFASLFGVPNTLFGYIAFSSLHNILAVIFALGLFPLFPLFAFVKNGEMLPKTQRNMAILASIISIAIALIPLIPTMAFVARYFPLWSSILIFCIPVALYGINKGYSNALLYFMAGGIPPLSFAMVLLIISTVGTSYVLVELIPLFAVTLSVLCITLFSIPFTFSNQLLPKRIDNKKRNNEPEWMHNSTTSGVPAGYEDEDDTILNAILPIDREDDTYSSTEKLSSQKGQRKNTVTHKDFPKDTKLSVHSDDTEEDNEEYSTPAMKERIVEAMNKEPTIIPYSPRELFVYLYRALKNFSENYNVELSWFVDPDLDENQEHDSDVIYNTLYSIGESLIINNPNSSVHISAKNITDTNLPSHIRFSIMITPEDTLNNFNSNSIANIADLIALAGGTLFMGNAQGKKMEMIITLPAVAKLINSSTQPIETTSSYKPRNKRAEAIKGVIEKELERYEEESVNNPITAELENTVQNILEPQGNNVEESTTHLPTIENLEEKSPRDEVSQEKNSIQEEQYTEEEEYVQEDTLPNNSILSKDIPEHDIHNNHEEKTPNEEYIEYDIPTEDFEKHTNGEEHITNALTIEDEYNKEEQEEYSTPVEAEVFNNTSSNLHISDAENYSLPTEIQNIDYPIYEEEDSTSTEEHAWLEEEEEKNSPEYSIPTVAEYDIEYSEEEEEEALEQLRKELERVTMEPVEYKEENIPILTGTIEKIGDSDSLYTQPLYNENTEEEELSEYIFPEEHIDVSGITPELHEESKHLPEYNTPIPQKDTIETAEIIEESPLYSIPTPTESDIVYSKENKEEEKNKEISTPPKENTVIAQPVRVQHSHISTMPIPTVNKYMQEPSTTNIHITTSSTPTTETAHTNNTVQAYSAPVEHQQNTTVPQQKQKLVVAPMYSSKEEEYSHETAVTPYTATEPNDTYVDISDFIEDAPKITPSNNTIPTSTVSKVEENEYPIQPTKTHKEQEYISNKHNFAIPNTINNSSDEGDFMSAMLSSVQEMVEEQTEAELEEIIPLFSDRSSVLIMDADANTRKLLTYFLDTLEYTVADVPSIPAMIQHQLHYPAHLIVIDVDSLTEPLSELIAEVHKIDKRYNQAPTIVVAIVSGSTSSVIHSGAAAVLSKPVNREDFRDLITQLLPERIVNTSRTAPQWMQEEELPAMDLRTMTIQALDTTDAVKDKERTRNTTPKYASSAVVTTQGASPVSAFSGNNTSLAQEIVLQNEPNKALRHLIASDNTTLKEENIPQEIHSPRVAITAPIALEVQSIPRELYPRIPQLLSGLQIYMNNAEMALRTKDYYKIIDVAQKISKECTEFSLSSMEKIALCIGRAATDNDEQAVVSLFEELANTMDTAVSLLVEVYESNK